METSSELSASQLNFRSPSPPSMLGINYSKAAVIDIEWFRKATAALRHHIYKILKPHVVKVRKI